MSKSNSTFAINGRFINQPITGVQRYAREVVTSIDRNLLSSGRDATIITPPLHCQPPDLSAIDIYSTNILAGHLWEQFLLPIVHRGPLINLCNTAPIACTRQIVCIHDANTFQAPDSYSWRFKTFYRALQPMIVRRAARVATVSQDAARQIAKYLHVDVGIINVLPNGHEHVFNWNADLATVFDNEPQDRPFILLLGSRAKHKNADLIFRLANFFDDIGIDLLVAGGDFNIFSAQGEIRASNIRFLGKVSDDDLALLFSRALCLAFPSFAEGFGLPVLEAMALGCPVISSNRSSLPEICGNAALMAGPDDPKAWVDHFRTLVSSRTIRSELSELGRSQASRYTWSRTAAGYIQLCGELN